MNQNRFKEIKKHLLDILFPKFCLECHLEGDWLCPVCQEKIVLVKSQVCPDCGRLSDLGCFCDQDEKPWGLRGIIVATYYDEGPIKELIHNFKYNHILELGEMLAEIMSQSLRQNLSSKQNLLITAVPLHFWRKSSRGYNQAEVLADAVAAKLKIKKNFRILQKIRQTEPQVSQSGKKRQKNLEKCFRIKSNINLAQKTIILIDDVTTTGTTLNECAKVLRRAGAKNVWGLVIAKG